jgi:hypothetical protein
LFYSLDHWQNSFRRLAFGEPSKTLLQRGLEQQMDVFGIGPPNAEELSRDTDIAAGGMLWANQSNTCPTGAPKALPPLRQAYIREVEALKNTAAELRTAGQTPEQIARTLHQMRRDIGIKYKELTPPERLEQFYQRNLEKYGDKLGPSIEYLRGQGKSWEEIIESASRTGGADLGLAKPQ